MHQGEILLQVDSLNEEVARFKAVSRVSEQDGHVKDALEKQIEEHRELHQKQVRTRGNLFVFISVTCLLCKTALFSSFSFVLVAVI